jgi:hypothetical protein
MPYELLDVCNRSSRVSTEAWKLEKGLALARRETKRARRENEWPDREPLRALYELFTQTLCIFECDGDFTTTRARCLFYQSGQSPLN